MGWLFKSGCSRRDLIGERTEDWQRTSPEGVFVKDDVSGSLLPGRCLLRRTLDRLGTIFHEGRR